MVESSAWGMALAVMAGVVNAFGAVLQKHAVDRTPGDRREDRFTQHLLHNPLWLLGFGMSLVLGTAFILLAQGLIGPALVPGLSATGLIVLAVASVMLIGEHLRPSELLGILLMVFGVLALGYSNLTIPAHEVDLRDGALVARIAAFTAALALGWLLSFLLARRTGDLPRGLSTAVSAGFAYALSNLWILPLMVTIGLVFGGTAAVSELVVFVVACVILVAVNLLGLRQVQEAYKFAPASKVQPLQQAPVQVVCILIYFLVYRRSAPAAAAALIPMGVAMVIASSFLLARRTADLRPQSYESEAPAHDPIRAP